MEYKIKFTLEFEKQLKKIKKKNLVLFKKLINKLKDIKKNPEHYKPLRNVLAGFNRIQFGSFVLIYKIEENVVRIISLDHHDKAY